MKNIKTKGLSLGFVALSVLALAACGDKSLQDQQSQQQQDDLNRQAPAAGKWTGPVTRNTTSTSAIVANNMRTTGTAAAIGAISITLTPQIVSSDTVGSDGSTLLPGRVALRVDVDYVNHQELQISADDSRYDSNLHTFYVKFPITRANALPNDAADTLEISGTIANGAFTGSIRALSSPGMAGQFVLTKNGQSPAVLAGTPPGGTSLILGYYAGSTQFQNGPDVQQTADVGLTVFASAQSPAQDLLDEFSVIKTVQFTLNYGKSATLVIPNVQWNRENGTWKGNVNNLVAGSQVELGLDCSTQVDQSMICKHITNSRTTIAQSTLKPVSAPQSLRNGGLPTTLPSDNWCLNGKMKNVADPYSGVSLQITDPAHSGQDELMSWFFPEQGKLYDVNVLLNEPLSNNVGVPGTNRVVPVFFPQSRFDGYASTLEGSATLIEGPARLKCTSFQISDSGQSGPFSCMYVGPHQTFTLTFPGAAHTSCQ